MVIDMKEIFIMDYLMEMVSLLGLTGLFIKVNLLIIVSLEKVSINGLTEVCMKVMLKMALDMDLEFIR